MTTKSTAPTEPAKESTYDQHAALVREIDAARGVYQALRGLRPAERAHALKLVSWHLELPGVQVVVTS